MEVHKNFIDGSWADTVNAQKNINPSDITDVVGLYGSADLSQVMQAVASAKAAFPTWASSTPQQRFNVLDFVGTEILAHSKELGHLLAREEGKVLSEATAEVNRAGHIFKFFAGEAVRLAGEHMRSVRPGIEIDTQREPLGVVGLITPWNFPIAIPAWKVAPAIAFGNTVVFKPADLAPGCAWALTEILSRSGLPNGVFNLVMGKGSVIGKAIVEHPDVAGVSFTGSVEIGRTLAVQCAQRMAKVQLEMGGKNPLVILDDADLDVAVNAAINGSYYATGQRCTASSRLIVTEGIHDRFVQAMIDRLKNVRVDDALAEGTDIGPVVDEAQLSKDLSYVELGRREGGKVVFGG